MKKNIKGFNEFINESHSYDPDHDNIMDIMKDKYGYGDLSWEYIDEFEDTDDFDDVYSDEEYASKLDDYINRYGDN